MMADAAALAATLGTTGARAMLAAVGPDIEFLPAGVHATLRALLDEALSEAELAVLPASIWDAAADRAVPAMLERDDHELALAVHAARPKGAGLVPRLWLRRAEDALVRWDTPAAMAYLDHTEPGPEDALLRVSQAALTALRLGRSEDALAAVLALAPAHAVQPVLPGLGPAASARLAGWRRVLSAEGYANTTPRPEDRVGVARLLVFGGVALDALPAGPLAAKVRGLLRQLLAERVWDGRPIARVPDAIEQKMPLIDELRRLADLELAEAEGLPVSDGVFLPAPRWLFAVAEDLSRRAPRALEDWEALIAQVTDERTSLVQLTGSLPQSAADILNGAHLEGLSLSGPLYSSRAYPEHRLPLRHALAAALGPQGQAAPVHDLLRPLAASAGILWPARLVPTRQSPAEQERDLARIILYADLAGLLSQLAQAAAQAWPGKEALALVAKDLARWNRAYDAEPEAPRSPPAGGAAAAG
jgi:hypothetical protein